MKLENVPFSEYRDSTTVSEDVRCSCYLCADMSDVIWEKFGKPKISNFWCIILVKKNITSFYVPVHYMWH